MEKIYSYRLSGFTVQDYYITGGLSLGFEFITIVLSIFISIVIWRTKSRLHTVNHLLICNSCIGSILHAVASSNGFIYLLFIEWETSDMSCRWRAYFTYAGMTGVLYSYMLLSISRFCFSVLSTKYRWVTKFKTHYIMISIQWVVVFLIPLSTLLTEDIQYIPASLCWIPPEAQLHTIYSVVACYCIPTAIVFIMYISIYCRLLVTKRKATTNSSSLHSQKRDLEVLRSIVIQSSMFLLGGLSIVLSSVVPGTIILYLIGLSTETFAIASTKVVIILLDRELRQVVKNMLSRKTTVAPFSNPRPVRKI